MKVYDSAWLKGVCDDNSSDSSCALTNWSDSCMAIQQKLGTVSEWRTRAHPYDRRCVDAVESVLKRFLLHHASR
jgi:hypothetical protein